MQTTTKLNPMADVRNFLDKRKKDGTSSLILPLKSKEFSRASKPKRRQVTYSEVKDVTLELLFALKRNATATDDDLAESWEDLKSQFNTLNEAISTYIKERES